ncbi:Ankyrin-3 [Cytospora mali]|uniref:Ankyrin-3 n=1 Tax=Cytospora mali TaxID=578113 RepID=A0A194W637_CYTMA|nr:Ankyrin-3 [Valsa mali]
MSSDNEFGDHAWGLDIIHDASSHDPSIDVIAVRGPGADDREEDVLLEGLHRQLNARIMLFGSAIKDGTDYLSPEGLSQIAGFLLKHLLLERPLGGYTENRRAPMIAFVGYGLGGIIIKKALVMAESDATFYSISQECNQLVFVSTPHRALKPTGWEDLLLGYLLTSSLPPSSTRNIVTRLRRLSTWLDELSADFISLRKRRCITNVYQHGEETKEDDLTGYLYSSTTGLVHEINLPSASRHRAILNALSDESVLAAIVSRLKAESKSEYRKCLSRLFEISPMFAIPDDHRDLYMLEPRTEVQTAYDDWLESASSCIITTTGDWGVGKSLKARALFHKLKRPSNLVAYFSFAEPDALRQSSLEPFLGSVIYQVLNQSPARYSRVEGLFAALEASNAWTEAGLLGLLRSLLDTMKDPHPLHLIIDDLHNCCSARELVATLTAAISNGSSLTNIKIAMFYDQQVTTSNAVEHALQKFDTFRIHGPDLTMDTLIPLANNLAEEAISSKSYLSGLKPQLSTALKECKHITEMLLTIQSLDISKENNPRTLKSLESLVSNPQLSLCDVVSSRFENLPDWGRTALGWIAHSKRPLRLNELTTAVALTNSRANFSSAFDPKGLPVEFAADLKTLFGPLVRLEGGGVIFSDRPVKSQFIDLIAAERKLSPAVQNSQKTVIPCDVEITRILFEYLSWQDLVVPVDKAFHGEADEFIQPPGGLLDLIIYAVRYLPFHYRTSKSIRDPPDLSQRRQFVLMWSRLNSKLNSTASPPHVCVADPLLLAAQLGFTETIKALEKSVMPPYREIAISLASWGGHVDTVRELLLGECANNTKAVNIVGALEYAAARGHDAIVEEIVTYIKENTPQSLPPLLGRLLCQAAELGYEKQTSMWIKHGANVNAASDNITPLQHAARNGHASLVRYLLYGEELRVKADVNSRIESCADRRTDEPILLATQKGYELVVQYLLAAQADVTCVTKDADKCTPLYLAAEYGHEAIVRLLLAAEKKEHPALNQQCSSHNNSPLMIACMKGHSEIVKLLLDENASLKLRDCEDHTALYHVLRPNGEDLAMSVFTRAGSFDNFEYKEICDVLLRATVLGFKRIIEYCCRFNTPKGEIPLVECRDPRGWRALHIAAANGQVAIAELLLDNEAELDPGDENGLTPLALAADAGEPEVVELLLDRGADPLLRMPGSQTILSRMACGSKGSVRHAKVVDMLLQRTDINPNDIDHEGRAALHWATLRNELEITKALLQHPKVNPTLTDRANLNALHFLAFNTSESTKELASLLIKAGVDPLGSDANGRLPIHWASRHGNVPLLELLWERNPESMEAKTEFGNTPLNIGACFNHIQAVEWLMQHGADGNARGHTGRTPLMMAASLGYNAAVCMLLRFGCDATLLDEDGATALHFAAGNGNVDAARELLNKQSEILSIKDKSNLSALHLAILRKKENFAAMLLDEVYPNTDEDTRLSDLHAIRNRNRETPLISAIRMDENDIVRQLLKLGSETEHRDRKGQTALLAAIRRPDALEMLRILLDPDGSNHADINAGGGEYPTALHNAAWYGKMGVVKELVKRGADVNAQGGIYNTALNAAAISSYHDIAMHLLELKEQKVDPNLSAGMLANALSAALHSQTYELVEPLLEAGVDINATDDQGRSAFHIAARRGPWEILQKLFGANEAGNPLPDKQGRTLIHHAAMSENASDFLQILVDENIDWDDIDIEDVDGWTPLHWACRQNVNLEIVKALQRLGADLNRATGDEWTPLNIALTHDAGDIADYIKEKLGPETVSDIRWKVGYEHSHISCDGCFLKPVVGLRWKCKNCPDFDFCFKCYWTAEQTHPSGHEFTAFPEGGNTGRTPEFEDISKQGSDEEASDHDEDQGSDSTAQS